MSYFETCPQTQTFRKMSVALVGTLAVATGSGEAKALQPKLVEPPAIVEVTGSELGNQTPISEVPPIALNLGKTNKYIFSTNHSTECQSSDPLSGKVGQIGAISLRCSSPLNRIEEGDFLSRKPQSMPKQTPWKSHYAGVMAAEILPSKAKDSSKLLVMIQHGENKNELRINPDNTDYYQNNINPEALAHPGPAGYPFGKQQTKGRDVRKSSQFYCPGGYMNANHNGQATGEHTIAPDGYVPRDLSFSGQLRDKDVYYSNCHEAYNGFISSAISRIKADLPIPPITRSSDRGPIIWPSSGYVGRDGKKVSWGVRHPSTMVDGKHLYIYYLDTSDSPDVNQGVIKVARSPISARGRAGSFKTWRPLEKGVNARGKWVPSLPFDNKSQFVDHRNRFYKTRGPISDGIINGSTKFDTKRSRDAQRGYLRFSPARLKGSVKKYIAVSQQYTKDTSRYNKQNCGIELKLHSSRDAIRWTKGVSIPGLTACKGAANKLFYPTLLNKNGLQDNVVDPEGFYIVGGQGGKPYRAKVKIK